MEVPPDSPSAVGVQPSSRGPTTPLTPFKLATLEEGEPAPDLETAAASGPTLQLSQTIEVASLDERSMRQRWQHLWRGLPTAGKATLVLSVVSAVLMTAYGVTAASVKVYGEEAHIATVIVMLAIFNTYAVFDAMAYENTLQLLSSIILSSLMLARVLWFVASHPLPSSLDPLLMISGSVISAVQLALICLSLLSCRQFGWRLYSKLGVDRRRKGSAGLYRLALVASAFNALLKLDFMFLLIVTALGIDVSVEHRPSVDGELLGISLAGLVVGLVLAAAMVMVASSEEWATRLRWMDAAMPAAYAAPMALIIVYHDGTADVVNAGTSVFIACITFMVTRTCLWVMVHLVVHNLRSLSFEGGRVMLRATSSVVGKGAGAEADSALAPLHEGAWLGKPGPRNPNKIRFFQLSHDGSTLRWGWHKFVLMFYVQEVTFSESLLTITMTFLLDPELTLAFTDLATLRAWRKGLDRLVVMLLTPDSRPSSAADCDEEADKLEQGLIHSLGVHICRASKHALPGASASLQGTIASGGAGLAASLHRRSEDEGEVRKRGGGVRSASVLQLQKRQQMAAMLQLAASSRRRSQPRWSPAFWLQRSRASSSVESEFASAASLKLREHVEHGDSGACGSKHQRRPGMVSVATQTESSEVVERAEPSRPASRSAIGGGDADIAAHYAQLLAAAAQAESQAQSSNDGTSTPSQQRVTYGGHIAEDKGIAAQYALAMAADTAHSGGVDLVGAPVLPSWSPRASHHAASPVSPLPLAALHIPAASPSYIADLVAALVAAPPRRGNATAALAPGSTSPKSPLALAISVDVVEPEELQMGKLLGAGSEGAVYAARFRETPVAVKRFARMEDSLHEVAMHLGVGSHDNVVALRALCHERGAMLMVLEYCARGTLDVMLHHSAKQQWDPARLLPIVRSIARGMHHLHSRGIAHRDLKPANIFVGQGQTMKIGDFGMSRFVPVPRAAAGAASPDALRRLSPGFIGTPQYAAPELINDTHRPEGEDDMEWALKLDMWSFGITLWEIMERRRPFEGLTQVRVQAQWLNTPYEARLPPVRVPELLDGSGKRVLRGLADLVEDCTRLDPLARPTFADVLRRLRGLAEQRGGVEM